MKKTLLSVLLFALLTQGLAQSLTQTIKGRVIDQQSRSPIIGATVLLSGSDPLLGTVTDVDGWYRLENVPVGRASLLCSSVGYETKGMANLQLGSGKELVVDIPLIESLEQLQAVEVIGDRQQPGQVLNEMATVSAISLSVEETSRYAATFQDPARAALSYAGVSTGGDDLLNEIVIRGNSPKGILWRLEGVEIPNPNHFAEVGSSAGGVSMLSANVLSNSDFYTGAFPAQYGNASSGIFDLNMRKGNFDKREHAFEAGLLGIAAASEGPLGGTGASYLVNYRYSTLGLFDKIGIEVLGSQEDVIFQDLSFKFHFPTKKFGSFSLWGLGGANTYSFKADRSIGQYFYEDEGQQMGVMGVTHIAYLGPDTYLESIVSASGYKQAHEEDSLRMQVLYKEDVQEHHLRFSSFLNHKFNARNTLRIGGIYSQLNFNLANDAWYGAESRFVTTLADKGGTQFYQTFAQWQHRINSAFTLNTGLHVSHLALSGSTAVEPRLGARYQLSPKGAFTMGMGLHSRMESLALYMASQEQEDGTRTRHNEDLGFTRAAHAVLGYEYQLRPDWRLKTEVYYQYLYDVPVWPTDTTSNIEVLAFSAINAYDGYTAFPLANAGVGKNYGVELTLEKFYSNHYYLMSTASLYQSRYAGVDKVERNTVFNGNYIFNLLGGREFKLRDERKTINVNGRFIYSGGKRATPILLADSREAGYTVRDYSRSFEQKLPDYVRFDLGVNYRKNNLKSASVISLNIQNVFAMENVFGNYYSPITDGIETVAQLGMFPNLSYKIEF